MNGFHSSGGSGIDTIGKDTYALVALEAPEQETGLLTRSGASGARRRGAGRGRWRLSGPARALKWARGAQLRTSIRRAIIGIIAQLNQLRNGVYSGRLRGLETGHSWMR